MTAEKNTNLTFEMLSDPKAMSEWILNGAISAATKATGDSDNPLPIHVIKAVCLYAMDASRQITSCAIRGPQLD